MTVTTQERCIAPAKVLSYNWPDGDPRHGVEGRVIPNEIYRDMVSNKKVGDTSRTWAGAPGTGWTDYRITRIDETGVYAVVIASTMRELTHAEVI